MNQTGKYLRSAKNIFAGFKHSSNIQTSSIVIRGFATYKSTTGMPGVPVDPDGKENLLKAANRVLEAAKVNKIIFMNICL